MPIIATCQCGRSWSGNNQAHCRMCHEHFSTVKNFDAHRPGPRKRDGSPTCGTPATITRTKRDGTVVPVLRSVKYADGPTWVSYTEDNRFEEPES